MFLNVTIFWVFKKMSGIAIFFFFLLGGIRVFFFFFVLRWLGTRLKTAVKQKTKAAIRCRLP